MDIGGTENTDNLERNNMENYFELVIQIGSIN